MSFRITVNPQNAEAFTADSITAEVVSNNGMSELESGTFIPAAFAAAKALVDVLPPGPYIVSFNGIDNTVVPGQATAIEIHVETSYTVPPVVPAPAPVEAPVAPEALAEPVAPETPAEPAEAPTAPVEPAYDPTHDNEVVAFALAAFEAGEVLDDTQTADVEAAKARLEANGITPA